MKLQNFSWNVNALLPFVVADALQIVMTFVPSGAAAEWKSDIIKAVHAEVEAV
jgi:hypothetical protein